MLASFFTTERNMMVAVLLNTIIIFLLAFPDLNNNIPLVTLDYFFVLLFTIEAIVKISTYGRKAYFQNGWNVFDFIIVILSLPSFFTFIELIPDLSFILLLRVLRLFRLLRFMAFVPNMKQLLSGLARAFKASIFVLIVLLGYNLILAILTCHLFGEVAPDYFGDPLISAYTIFQLFTVEGWNEISENVASKFGEQQLYWIKGLTRFSFMLIVLSGGIFGMSLANAVFVDEMTIDNNAELEHKIESLETKIDQLREILETSK